MSDEQKVPTKEEILRFLQEQIDVKKVQLELQEINTALAVNKMEELKALSIIGQIQMGSRNQKPAGTEHVVTQEDMDANPEFAEQGIKVGDTVIIPDEPTSSEPTENK